MPDNDNTEGELADRTHHVHDEVPTSLARRVRKEDRSFTPVKPDDLSDPRIRSSLVAAVQEGNPDFQLPENIKGEAEHHDDDLPPAS